MKKFLPLILITSLILSACSIWNKEDVFQKKQECFSQKEAFEKNSGDTVIEIFYSKKINSCVVRYFRNETQYHFLQDLFSNKVIASAEDPLSCVKTFKWIKEREERCYPEKRDFEKTYEELKSE